MDFEEEQADDEDTMNPEDVEDEETKEAKVDHKHLFLVENCSYFTEG